MYKNYELNVSLVDEIAIHVQASRRGAFEFGLCWFGAASAQQCNWRSVQFQGGGKHRDTRELMSREPATYDIGNEISHTSAPITKMGMNASITSQPQPAQMTCQFNHESCTRKQRGSHCGLWNAGQAS